MMTEKIGGWLVGIAGLLSAMGFTSPVYAETIEVSDSRTTFEYKGITYRILNDQVEPITLTVESVDAKLTGELTLAEELSISGLDASGKIRKAIVLRIGDKAFSRSSITKVSLPSTITGIGSEAFSYSNIEEIEMQEGILNIGVSAFKGAHIREIKVPESAVMLDYGCFMGNFFDLEKVYLPSTLRALGGSVFEASGEIKDIYSYAVEPPIASDSDFGMQTKYSGGDPMPEVPSGPSKYGCVIHVPEEYVELYKNASGWNNFVNIVALDTSDANAILSEADETIYYVAGGNLSVNANPGDEVAVYDANGICLQRKGFVESGTFHFSGSGIYILSVNNKSVKIAM